MSMITTIWSMIAGACAMLGVMHLMLWWRDRSRRYYLLSATMAAASGASALVESRLMQTATIPAYMDLVRLANVIVGVILVAMIWFVHGYLRRGRRWLALTITALWSAGLAINAFAPGSLTFSRITSLAERTTFWGESFFLAVGEPNPAKYLADLASVLILAYVLDATLQAWRTGARRSAVIVGGSITLFITAAGIHTPLVDAGVVTTPPLISAAFLAIVLALSFQLADDASRMVRLAREVRAGERRWRMLLDGVQLAVVDVDPHGLVRLTNPFFETLTGRSSESVQGRPLAALVAPDETDELRHRLQVASREGPRPHSRWTLTTADGGTRTLDWSSVRLLSPDGEFDGVLGIGADVTEEVATRRDLDRTRDRLDRVVRAGMLGELVSALSHELNQPLAAILSNAQAARLYLSRSDPPLDEVRAILDGIVRDEKRAAAVIARLQGLLVRGEIVREVLDLESLVGDVAALVNGQLDNHDITLRIDMEEGIPCVVAGRVEMQQVVLNLLLNALHALEGTTGTERSIAVTARRSRANVTLAVQDSGPGVAPDQIDHVFEPFQGDRDGHVGMGLAICRRIVEAYGGSISAENTAIGGAVFTVTLPAADQAPRFDRA